MRNFWDGYVILWNKFLWPCSINRMEELITNQFSQGNYKEGIANGYPFQDVL